MKKISVVVPMYNEEKMVFECYSKLKDVIAREKEYSLELVVINDGSEDETEEILTKLAKQDNMLKVISFSRNFGHQAAITAGLKYATGDVIAIIDADMQDPPEVIQDMLRLWEQGNDVVYGKRTKRKGESVFKVLSAKMFYELLDSLSDTDIPKNTGDFRLVDRRVIDVINELPEQNKFLRGLFSWVGFKQVACEYEREKRKCGKTKYSISKMFKLAMDGIFSFSTKPLKLVGKLGIFSIILSIGILIYSLVSYAFNLNNLVPGWTSIMVTVTMLGGVQLLSLWVMSEYIGRIYNETKNRPQYIIAKKINIEK